MEIKYTDWPKINLAEFKEAQYFGPLNPVTGKKILRGSQHYNRTHALDEEGFLKMFIDYTDPACPFRDEFTQDWPDCQPSGTEEIWTYVLKFAQDYAPTNCKTPKSITQFYCRKKDNTTDFGDVMFQLELTGETQVKPEFPLGSVQVIHANYGYRKATSVIPKGGEKLFVKIRIKHGLGDAGYVKCELNGQVVYEKKGDTVFSQCPEASPIGKICIYDHMCNNEGSKNPTGNNNRLKHLNAGIKNLTIAVSPVTIARRLPTDPAFGDWIEAQVDPYRFKSTNDSALQAQIDELQKQVDALEKQNADLSTENDSLKASNDNLSKENADLETQLGEVRTKTDELNSAQSEVNKKIGELNEILDG